MSVERDMGPPGGSTSGRQADKPLMRSLGEFFGHIVQGIKTDPSRPAPADRAVTRQQVQEEKRETPEGTVILRRTIIEEVELPRDGGPKAPPGA